MNKYVLCLIAITGFVGGIAFVNAQSVNKTCGTSDAWQQAIQIDPSLVQRRQQTEAQINQYLNTRNYSRTGVIDSDEVRIIPTVFHILEQGGTENISDSWVNSCISITNNDYRRMNADTTDTPLAFRPVAADTKIEFRLATIDPNGNCTNGITRTYTHRTVNFNDYGKSIIDWPSDKYFNIWVVQTINNGAAGVPGEVIGYAQFPLMGLSGTDGVVLKYDFVGNLSGNSYEGRDGDHEIGHYLDLIHIWGDADCGDDHCADTPTQFGPNFGCPTYPQITCGNNGDMSDNYMDYSDGSCKDIFTLDQKARMRATLDVARYSLWQPSNLAATGTADPYVYPALCPPNADFLPIHKTICPHSSITFKINTTNGTPTAWNWSFPGGTPSSSSLPNPGAVTYNNQGAYDVTLIVSNAQGSDTMVKGDAVLVDWGFGVTAVPFSEGFEGNSPLPGEWKVFNDDGGPAWQRTNRASYSGSYSMSIQNYETYSNTAPGSYKELISPSFNFSRVTQPVLTFRLAYGQQSSGNADSLSIGVSTSCGASWTEVKHLAGSALAVGSGGFQPNNYSPSSDQWMLVSIPLNSYAGNSNVKFHFLFITGALSNNIYIDDININGVVGISEEMNDAFSFNVDPNPASESFNINYTLKRQEDLTINLYDLQGRLISQLESKHESPGAHEIRIEARSFNLATGVYVLKMITPDGVISKKLVYSSN